MATRVTKLLFAAIVLVGFCDIAYCDIEQGHILHIVQTSYRECVNSCDIREHCKSALYSRKLALCELYDHANTVNSTELINYQKQLVSTSITAYIDYPGEYCDTPKPIPGTAIRGNMASAGSKIKYQCDGKMQSLVSECMSTGEWSMATQFLLSCICSQPTTSAGDVLTHVNRWEVTSTDVSNIKAVPICEAGYSLVSSTPSAVCKRNGSPLFESFGIPPIWSSVNLMCCHKLTDNSWVKILSFSSSADIYNLWTYDYRDPSDCNYRNNDIIKSWQESPPNMVRVTVMRNDIEQAWITFNGTGTKLTSWFAKETFLASSWSGLTLTDDLVISLKPARDPRIYFFIGSTESLQQREIPYGFLTVAHRQGRNPNAKRFVRPMIIYSVKKQMVNLDGFANTTEDVDRADSLEIWVKF